MATNRERYKCLNVDPRTYQMIRALAKAYRRSLIAQIRVMAGAEYKNLADVKLIPDIEEKKAERA